MRILVLPKEFPSKERPNAGIFILRRAKAVRDLGHDVEVLRIVPFAPQLGARWRAYASIPRVEEIDGIRVHTIRALIPPRMIAMEYLPLQVGGAVARHVARFKPDVLHASFLIPCGQVAVRQRLPTVVTAHGGDAYLWPSWRPGLYRATREAIAGATRVTAVSEFIAGRVRSIYDRRVDVIINGADESIFFPRDRAASRTRLGFPPDRRVIAFAGNIFRRKGVFELLDAAAKMRTPAILAMAGEGPDRAQLERAARDARVEMRFLGRLDGNGIADLFSAADVVTLPSYAEGLPNVVCEAMLCGRAVVATSAGGIPEVVQHGSTGLLVPAEDATALHAALERVLDDERLRSGFEAAAREYAERNLTWTIAAKGYERVYAAAIASYPEVRANTPRRMQNASS